MAEIVVRHGSRIVLRTQLAERDLSIGRDAGNDVVIEDPRVSRSHARILRRGGDYVLQDCGSTHGCHLGEERVTERVLRDGDVIRLGDRTLTFLVREGGALPADGQAGGEAADFQTMLLQPGAPAESARRLEALFEISRTLEAARDFNGVLAEILDKAIAIMGAERGFIMLRDRDTRELKVHVARDRKGAITGVDAETVSRSLMKKVVESGEPVVVRNALAGGEWGTESMLANQIHSALCVPLKAREEVAGVLYVDHRSRVSAFTDQDLAFLTTFALQAHAAIHASRAYWELLDSLFKASDDFIVVCAPDRTITQANRGAAKLTASSEGDLTGRKLDELFAAEHQLEARKLCADTLQKGLVSGVELVLENAHGPNRPLGISSFALKDKQDNPVGLCLIGRDLSQLRSLIDMLTGANAKLRELNDMKSQFVGMIAHELKSPLSVVVGYVDLLLQNNSEPPSPKQREHLEKIMGAGERLIGLIQELLELTRLETGKTALRLGPVDAKKMLYELAENYELRARQAEVEVHLKAAEDLPVLEGDKDLIWRVFDNFFSNGIKYNKRGGKLLVEARRVKHECEFSFRDEGIGMSEEDQKRLFERFFRADNVGKIPGTGLGLSIVKAVVERHAGRIAVESKLGEGTTFRVTLPLKPPEPEVPAL